MSHRRNPRAKIVRRITLTRTETKDIYDFHSSIWTFEDYATSLCRPTCTMYMLLQYNETTTATRPLYMPTRSSISKLFSQKAILTWVNDCNCSQTTVQLPINDWILTQTRTISNLFYPLALNPSSLLPFIYAILSHLSRCTCMCASVCVYCRSVLLQSSPSCWNRTDIYTNVHDCRPYDTTAYR